MRKQAPACFREMINKGLDTAINVPGERSLDERQSAETSRDMWTTGVNNISARDVNIDFDWAD